MKIFFTDIKPNMMAQLEAASSEIKVAVSWLTDKEIFSLLLKKLKAGISVSIITRNDYLNNHPNALPWKKFIDEGGELRFCQPGYMLHYKFCLIDQQIAFATSYNWTCFAGTNNRENIILFDSVEAIKSFKEEFQFLSQKFPMEKNPPRIELQTVNNKLHGFYEMTIDEDERNQHSRL